VRTIWKYALGAPVFEVTVPKGGIVRLVETDPATGYPAVWIEHDGGDAEVRTFVTVGTGGGVEEGLEHRGSVIAGSFVWHVYERTLAQDPRP